MKRLLSFLLAAAVVMSQMSIVFAEAVTVKQSNIKYSSDNCSINMTVPYLEGFKGAEDINRIIRNKTADYVGNIKASAVYNKKFEEDLAKSGQLTFKHMITLNTTYDCFKSGILLSLQLNTYNYTGGAHGLSWIDSITANTSTGEIYTLKNLFKDNSDYAGILTDKIIAAVKNSPEYYFDDYAKSITEKKGNFDFYIDGDNLVIYFGLYEIAPYAAGIRRFVFKADDLKDILKDEVYTSIKDAAPITPFRLNGENTEYNNTPITGLNGIMVPLRRTAETLGYIVGWDEEKGASIAGGYIKEGVNSYWTYGKEPAAITEPLTVDGIMYVPSKYFTDILEENISCGFMAYTYVSDNAKKNLKDSIIRVFGKDSYNDNFNRLIVDLTDQQTDLDCVKAFAEAVRNRNGAEQYGLFTQKLRDEQYSDLSSRYFVTGVSSPWVESYDIRKTGDNAYEITFHTKTSASPGPDEIAVISLEKVSDNFKISSIYYK